MHLAELLILLTTLAISDSSQEEVMLAACSPEAQGHEPGFEHRSGQLHHTDKLSPFAWGFMY